MPHDGQDLSTARPAAGMLPDLLALTAEAVPAVEAVQQEAVATLRARVVAEGRVSASAAAREAHQHAAHGLAWLPTYAEALRRRADLIAAGADDLALSQTADSMAEAYPHGYDYEPQGVPPVERQRC